MTAMTATIIGIILQLLGAGYLVAQTWLTSRKLARYQTSVTYNNLGSAIDALAQELGNQFGQQLVGFAFVLIGSGLQLYATIAS